jgi:4-carboxymuconolactone decarboxylase
VRALLESWDKEFADITIEAGFNELYAREEQIDLKTRELCTNAILCSLGKPEELNLHLLAAFNVGWTFEELREVFILCAIPAGWPASLDALRYLCEWCEAHGIETADPLEMREDYYTADWYQIGYDKGAQLFGEESWKKYLNDLSLLDPDLANFVVVNLYGKLLTRETLDDRTRELCLVAAFAALKDKQNLKLHIKGALNSGATATEVREILFHVGLYAGQDATSQAIEVYREMS